MQKRYRIPRYSEVGFLVTFLFAVVGAWAVAVLVDPDGLVVTWLVIEFGKGEEGEGRV
jgi:hypothetical protein